MRLKVFGAQEFSRSRATDGASENILLSPETGTGQEIVFEASASHLLQIRVGESVIFTARTYSCVMSMRETPSSSVESATGTPNLR